MLKALRILRLRSSTFVINKGKFSTSTCVAYVKRNWMCDIYIQTLFGSTLLIRRPLGMFNIRYNEDPPSELMKRDETRWNEATMQSQLFPKLARDMVGFWIAANEALTFGWWIVGNPSVYLPADPLAVDFRHQQSKKMALRCQEIG